MATMNLHLGKDWNDLTWTECFQDNCQLYCLPVFFCAFFFKHKNVCAFLSMFICYDILCFTPVCLFLGRQGRCGEGGVPRRQCPQPPQHPGRHHCKTRPLPVLYSTLPKSPYTCRFLFESPLCLSLSRFSQNFEVSQGTSQGKLALNHSLSFGG